MKKAVNHNVCSDLTIEVSSSLTVSGLCLRPKTSKALLLLAHGAGAGMRHPFMEQLANQLAAAAIATLRFQFPYMELGKKRPDPPKLAVTTIVAAAKVAGSIAPDLPLFAGGKSFGARMSSTALAESALPMVRGFVAFGFPLHQPNTPAVQRAAHLAAVKVPMLFLQGTRDALADLTLMEPLVKNLQPLARMQILAGSDHSFAVLKSSGRTSGEVLLELAKATADFVDTTLA